MFVRWPGGDMRTKINGWIDGIPEEKVGELITEIVETVERYGGEIFSTWVSETLDVVGREQSAQQINQNLTED